MRNYFLNLIAILAANPQENKVNPIGNTPLESICGICSSPVLSEEFD